MRSIKDVKEKMMRNPEFRNEYEKLEPSYHIAELIIQARLDADLTQEQLAERLDTKQANISRLESGTYNPSIKLLRKVAKATGHNLVIDFK